MVSAVLIAPAASALPRVDVDCYTWTMEVCSSGGCTSYECDQCDFYVGGVYAGTTGGCGG